MGIGRLLIAGSLFVGLCAPAWAADTTIIISGSGGTLTDVQKAVYQDRFTAKAGIKVENIATTNRVSALRAMKLTGKVQWDLTELSGPEYQQAVNAGFLHPIDWNVVDPQKRMPDIARQKYGLASASYSTVLAVRTKSPAFR